MGPQCAKELVGVTRPEVLGGHPGKVFARECGNAGYLATIAGTATSLRGPTARLHALDDNCSGLITVSHSRPLGGVRSRTGYGTTAEHSGGLRRVMVRR